MENNYEVIFCIVNSGFSDEVMTLARSCGAKGGTVINARGTANEEAEKKYNISIHPEKEIIMILVDVKIKEAIFLALNEKLGILTEAQGIIFSLPVDEVAGLKMGL